METSNIIIDTGGNIIDNPKEQIEFMQDVCDIGGNIVATTYTKLLKPDCKTVFYKHTEGRFLKVNKL